MQYDRFRRILDTPARIESQLTSVTRATRAMEASANWMQVAQSLDRYRDLVAHTFGPLEDLRLALDATFKSNDGILKLQNMLTEMGDLYRLPQVAEVNSLLQNLWKSWENSQFAQYMIQVGELHKAMASITTPWIDTANASRSVQGIAELHAIGNAINTQLAFDQNLVEALRSGLGDWRKELIWSPAIFDDSLARTSFYLERGLNPDLTYFPSNAFEQIVTDAGLKELDIASADEYDSGSDSEVVEADFKRNNDAHDILQRFETQVRKFIDERMREAFGSNWIKHQVPGEIRKQWIEKQQKEGQDYQSPLIAYADFSDYVQIITRGGNWEDVFKEIFGRKGSVQESFQRLYPIRICTMHARIITQDDELYLYVETKRILKAIGVED